MLNRLLTELFGRKRASASPPGASPADGQRSAAGLLDEADAARKRADLGVAERHYRRALAADPGLAEAWLGLGLCRFRAGDLFAAHFNIRTALKVRPRDADILNELGLVEHAFGNLSGAHGSFEAAVDANPEHPEAWNNYGLVLGARGKMRGARRCFLRAVSIRPAFYTALTNLGLACRHLELLEEAEAHLRKAIDAAPQLPAAWLNLGAVQQDAGRLAEALSAFERARELSPRDVDVVTALANARYWDADPEAAERGFREALAIDAGSAEAGLGLAHVLLARGRFGEGWDQYEARLRSRDSPARRLPFPAWDGGPLRGKRIFVYGEQGIGEEVMFASCLPDALREAAHCFLLCNPRLRKLFARSFPQAEIVGEVGDWHAQADRGVDACLPIGSLPRLYRRNRAEFPAHQGYLRADPTRVAYWRERLKALGARSYGVAWRGGRASTGRAARSLTIEQLLPVFQVPGTAWISLQPATSIDERRQVESVAGVTLHYWPEALADMDETAALMQALDGIVSVCSTAVHLGGALGVPVQVLAPRVPAWRYLLEGELPWYPSARMIRQARDGWPQVVQAAAVGLRQ